MLLELMDQFGVEPERTLMIGDTTHDLLMALNAGTAAIGVSYGAREPATFAAYTTLHIAHSVADLQWLARPNMPDSRQRGRFRLCASADLADRGKAFVFDVLHWRQPARAFAHALRRPGGGLPEPLRARAHRDGLAVGRVPRPGPRIHRLLDPRRRATSRAPAAARGARAAAASLTALKVVANATEACIGVLPATPVPWCFDEPGAPFAAGS